MAWKTHPLPPGGPEIRIQGTEFGSLRPIPIGYNGRAPLLNGATMATDIEEDEETGITAVFLCPHESPTTIARPPAERFSQTFTVQVYNLMEVLVEKAIRRRGCD